MFEKFHLSQARLRLSERFIGAELSHFAAFCFLLAHHHVVPADFLYHGCKYICNEPQPPRRRLYPLRTKVLS